MFLIADPEDLSDSLSIKMASSVESPVKSENDNCDALNNTASITNKQEGTPLLEKGSSTMSIEIGKFDNHENSYPSDESSNLYENGSSLDKIYPELNNIHQNNCLHLKKTQIDEANMEKVAAESMIEEAHIQVENSTSKSNTLNHVDDQQECEINESIVENIPETVKASDGSHLNENQNAEDKIEQVSLESMIENDNIQEEHCSLKLNISNHIDDQKECEMNSSPADQNFDSNSLSGHASILIENENSTDKQQSLDSLDPYIITEVAINDLTRDCKDRPALSNQSSPIEETLDTSSPVKKYFSNISASENITGELTNLKHDVSDQTPEVDCSLKDSDKNIITTDGTPSENNVDSNKIIKELEEPADNSSSIVSSCQKTDIDEPKKPAQHEKSKNEPKALAIEESMQDELPVVESEICSIVNTPTQNEFFDVSNSVETETIQDRIPSSYTELTASESDSELKDYQSITSDRSNVSEKTAQKQLDNGPQIEKSDVEENNIKQNENMETKSFETIDENLEEMNDEILKESLNKDGNDANLKETNNKNTEESIIKMTDERNDLKVDEINDLKVDEIHDDEEGDDMKLEETNNANLDNANTIKLNEDNVNNIQESNSDKIGETSSVDKIKDTKSADVTDNTELDSKDKQNSDIKLIDDKKADEVNIINRSSDAECDIIEIDNEQKLDTITTNIIDLEDTKMDVDNEIDSKLDTESKTNELSEAKINTLTKPNNKIQILEIDDDVNMEESNIEKTVENACESIPNKCVTIDDDDDIMLIDDEIGKITVLAGDNAHLKNNESDSHPGIAKDNMKHANDKDVGGELLNVKDGIDAPLTTSQDESSTAIDSPALQSGVSSEESESNIPKNVESKQSVNVDPPKEDSTKVKDFVASDFIKTFKTKVCNMSKDDLEEFCLLKIIESIADRSHLSEIKSKLKSMTQCVEEWRKKAALLTKQNRDLQIVMKTIEDELAKRSSGAITPLKITRSVGLQVLMTDDKPQKRYSSKQKAANLAPKMPNKAVTKQTPPIPVPRLVPAQNNKSSKPIVPVAPPNNVVGKVVTVAKTPPKMPEKRPYCNVSIDLTDDEPPAKIIQKQAVRVVPPQQLMGPRPVIAQQSPTTPKKVFIPISGNQPIRPGQALMFKTVPPNSVRPGPRQTGPLFRMNGNTLRMVGPRPPQRHPAALPHAPNPTPMHGAKAVPPAPELKISKVENGIVISWKMDAYREDIYEDIASYQLYAYQETSTPPNSSLWKKIGDVKALPLPMACTLTQFMAGFKYFFAVRAVDVKSRIGPFSMPGSILLLNK